MSTIASNFLQDAFSTVPFIGSHKAEQPVWKGWSQSVSCCAALKVLIRDFIWGVGADWFSQLAPYQRLHAAGDELGLSSVWTVQEVLFSTERSEKKQWQRGALKVQCGIK